MSDSFDKNNACILELPNYEGVTGLTQQQGNSLLLKAEIKALETLYGSHNRPWDDGHIRHFKNDEAKISFLAHIRSLIDTKKTYLPKRNIVFTTNKYVKDVYNAISDKKDFSPNSTLTHSIISNNGAIEIKVENGQMESQYLLEKMKSRLGVGIGDTFIYLMYKLCSTSSRDFLLDYEEYFEMFNKVDCHKNKENLREDLKLFEHVYFKLETVVKENKKFRDVAARGHHMLTTTEVRREYKQDVYKSPKIKSITVHLGERWEVILKELQEKILIYLPPNGFSSNNKTHPLTKMFQMVMLFRWRSNSSRRKKNKLSEESISIRNLYIQETEWERLEKEIKKHGLFDNDRGPYNKFMHDMNEAASKLDYRWAWQHNALPTSGKEFKESYIVFRPN